MSRDDFDDDEPTSPERPLAPFSEDDKRLLNLIVDLNSVQSSLRRIVEFRETAQGDARRVLELAAGEPLRQVGLGIVGVADAMIERGRRAPADEAKKGDE